MSDVDVLIVGAGPAGTVAATVLARAGATVRILDRATFPRDKLCGDTVNPGTLVRLRHLQMAGTIDRGGLPVHGMLVTGEGGVAIEGRYPNHQSGRSLSRSEFDWSLLQQAMAAGAQFEAGVTVRGAVVTQTPRGAIVEGVTIGSSSIRARVTIAADGRRSTLAFGLGLASHPARPRRWAVGAYFAAVAPRDGVAVGEMHIRTGRYIGVAPLPGGITNVCVVRTHAGPRSGSGGQASRSTAPGPADFRDPAGLLRAEIDRDAQLRERFADARLIRPPVVIGPLAVDGSDRSFDGLILAGDAAGFIDPMTGDGLRFAVRGGELAAAAALSALQHGWTGVHATLAAARRREFAAKWRFNRTLRLMIAWPPAVRVAAAGARISPGLVRAIIARAGDCQLSDPEALAAAPRSFSA